MFRLVAICALAAALTLVGGSYAATPEAKLAKAPFDADTWAVVSTSTQHGQVQRWVAKDGSRWSRYSLLLRGFKTEIDQQITFAPNGAMLSLEVRGSVPQGDAAEAFRVTKGQYAFSTPVDRGSGTARDNLFYLAFGGTIDAQIALYDALRRAPDRSIDLVPSGRLTLDKLTTAEVSNGRVTRTLTAYVVNGFGFAPRPVWYDGDQFFGTIGNLSFVPDRWKAAVPALSKAQDEALAARAPERLARLAPKATQPVVFTDVSLFDAEAGKFLKAMTVVVADGKIAAVGPAASTEAPANARVIEGKGKTLIPGLWDSHQHYGNDSEGPLLLSQGITSVRDPGNRPDELMARKKRIDEGQLLGPRIVPSLLIDGPGRFSAQTAVVVKTEEEAIAAVKRAKAEGYFGVKLYGSLKPAFVQPMAEEAHRLGLRVHGHVPAGMRTIDAVRAGYDEITHMNFVMMQAMPDAVLKESNGMQRFFGPGKHGVGVDFKSAAMTEYFDELAKNKVTVDPTLAVLENTLTGERGKLSKAYAPFEGTLPSTVERGSKGGSVEPPPELVRDTMRKSFARLTTMVGEVHRRGVAVVAGTDGTGLLLVRDLELYVEGGLTPAQALAAATIVPARVYGAGAESGSITVGKNAELALIDGDPSKRIGDLRYVEIVMRDGRLMKADDLRAEVGITGMPKRVK